MANPIAYDKISVGFEFPPGRCKLDSEMIETYLQAVGETSSLYREGNLVPPTALAACAMLTLSGNVSFPPGSIHVSQELEFVGTVCREDTITCLAKVSRRQDRGKLHLISIDLDVYKENSRVMTGRLGFVMPEAAAESK